MTANDPPASGFVDIGQGRLYYEVAGHGPAVVLIHAGIADSRMWDDQFASLAQSYRVVRYDMRGFGRTEPGSEPFSDWRDLTRLLEHLELSRVVVVGVSMGARVAVEFALEQPESVGGLVLVSPGLFGDEPRSDALVAGWRQIEAAFDAGDIERAIDIESDLWVVGPTREPETVSAHVRRRVREMNARVWELEEASGGRVTMSPPAVSRLAEIQVPALVIAGQNDQSDILDVADRLAREIDGAENVIIENAAHMLTMEQPGRFSDVLIGFFKNLKW